MQTAVIKGGESLSSAISQWKTKFLAIDVPDSFTGTTITFQGGDVDFNTKNLYDASGLEVSATVTPGAITSLDSIALSLAPFRALKVRSGTSASPTVQLGETASSATVDFGEDKTLTITSGVKGTRGDGLVFIFQTDDEDTLSASAEGRSVTVLLADTTASKNTAALIQAAIQALGTVDDVDVSALTVVASDEYTAAPPVGVKAASVLDMENDRSLTFTAGHGGIDGNGVTIRVENNTTDTLSVTNPAETDQILIKLATTTREKNADTAIETAVRALATAGEYDISAMTVTGNAAYDASPPAGTKAVSTVTLYDVDGETYTSLGVLTITSGAVGTDGQAVLHNLLGTIEVNTSDALAIAEGELIEGLPNVTLKLANTTPGNNTAAAIQAILRTVTCPLYADHIAGLTVEADSTWTASPPVAFDEPDKQTVNGTLPLLNVQTGELSGGEDTPEVEGILSGGADSVIGIIMKE